MLTDDVADYRPQGEDDLRAWLFWQVGRYPVDVVENARILPPRQDPATQLWSAEVRLFDSTAPRGTFQMLHVPVLGQQDLRPDLERVDVRLGGLARGHRLPATTPPDPGTV